MPDIFLLTTCAAVFAAATALRHARAERRHAEHFRLDSYYFNQRERDILDAIRGGNWSPYVTDYQTYPPEPPLDGRRAAVVWRSSKKSNLAENIKALKYRKLTRMQATAVAAALAHDLERQFLSEDWRVNVITGVPGDPERSRARGFNPSDLLASELARRVNLRYRPLLSRVRSVSSQVEAATLDARRSNIAGAFVASPCAGKAVLVVDDVATTGATLIECARALKQAGAVNVYALTLAGGKAHSVPPRARRIS